MFLTHVLSPCVQIHAMFSDHGSPTHAFQESMARLVHGAATLSYTLADDIHSLVDDPRPGSGRLSARIRKFLIAGLIISGTTISTLAKIGGGSVLWPIHPTLQLASTDFVKRWCVLCSF